MTSSTCAPQPLHVTFPHWRHGAGLHIGHSFTFGILIGDCLWIRGVLVRPRVPRGVCVMQLGSPLSTSCGCLRPVRVWFTEFEYSLVFFTGLTILFLAPFISRQYSKFGRFAGWPALVSATVALYGVSLIAFTMFPLPDFAGGYCERRAGSSPWQLTPLGSLDDVTAYAEANGLLATLSSGVLLQVLMNVIFFLPLGFFLAYRSRRSLPTTTLIAFTVSLGIEITQGTGLYGLAPCPYRLADVDDLLTNTAGGIVGWFIGVAVRRFLPDPTPKRLPDPGPPGLVREGVGVLLDVYTFVLLVAIIVVIGNVIGLSFATDAVRFSLINLIVSLVLFVVVPAFRRDRAGPGVASVHMVLVRSWDGASPAMRWSLLVRWVIRWLPVAYFGLLWLVIIVSIDFLVAGLSPTKRSLSMRLTATRYATREHIRGANRSEAVEATP